MIIDKTASKYCQSDHSSSLTNNLDKNICIFLIIIVINENSEIENDKLRQMTQLIYTENEVNMNKSFIQKSPYQNNINSNNNIPSGFATSNHSPNFYNQNFYAYNNFININNFNVNPNNIPPTNIYYPNQSKIHHNYYPGFPIHQSNFQLSQNSPFNSVNNNKKNINASKINCFPDNIEDENLEKLKYNLNLSTNNFEQKDIDLLEERLKNKKQIESKIMSDKSPINEIQPKDQIILLNQNNIKFIKEKINKSDQYHNENKKNNLTKIEEEPFFKNLKYFIDEETSDNNFSVDSQELDFKNEANKGHYSLSHNFNKNHIDSNFNLKFSSNFNTNQTNKINNIHNDFDYFNHSDGMINENQRNNLNNKKTDLLNTIKPHFNDYQAIQNNHYISSDNVSNNINPNLPDSGFLIPNMKNNPDKNFETHSSMEKRTIKKDERDYNVSDDYFYSSNYIMKNYDITDIINIDSSIIMSYFQRLNSNQENFNSVNGNKLSSYYQYKLFDFNGENLNFDSLSYVQNKEKIELFKEDALEKEKYNIAKTLDEESIEEKLEHENFFGPHKGKFLISIYFINL